MVSAKAWDPSTAPRLDGKTVLITGASSGLGQEAAGKLAGLGATVVLAWCALPQTDEKKGTLRSRALRTQPQRSQSCGDHGGYRKGEPFCQAGVSAGSLRAVEERSGRHCEPRRRPSFAALLQLICNTLRPRVARQRTRKRSALMRGFFSTSGGPVLTGVSQKGGCGVQEESQGAQTAVPQRWCQYVFFLHSCWRVTDGVSSIVCQWRRLLRLLRTGSKSKWRQHILARAKVHFLYFNPLTMPSQATTR